MLEEISSSVVNLLIQQGFTVSTAESCTGGMIASSIVSVPGASSCFNEGYVTYSNEAKHRILGVSLDTLEKYGAVSKETAKEMAQGVKKVSKATFGLASTGIAGPDGGTKEKPVGLIYIACAFDNGTDVIELRLHGDRLKNRTDTVCAVLSLLQNKIREKEEMH